MVGMTVAGAEGGGAVWGGAVEEPAPAEDMIGDAGRGGGNGGRGGRGCCERREVEERESAVVFGYSEFVFEFCDALVTRRTGSEISESFY